MVDTLISRLGDGSHHFTGYPRSQDLGQLWRTLLDHAECAYGFDKWLEHLGRYNVRSFGAGFADPDVIRGAVI